MTEGRVPEIPQHLIDSVLSVGAHEQRARREFQIAHYARKRQIPKESLETNETVRRYVTVLRDADVAVARLGRFEMIDPILDERPDLRVRTNQVLHLYGAERMILEEGLNSVLDGGVVLPRPLRVDPLDGKGSLTGRLDLAGKPYGVAVDVPEGWVEQREYEVCVLGMPEMPEPEPASGLWAGASFTTGTREPWRRQDGNDSWWYWPDWPNGRHDPEHLRALAAEATQQGIDPDLPAVDGIAHTMLTAIVYGRQLVAETEDVSSLPFAPGLTPSAHERLTRVAPLNRLAVAILEDALHPGRLTPESVAAELETVARPSGLVVSRHMGTTP